MSDDIFREIKSNYNRKRSSSGPM